MTFAKSISLDTRRINLLSEANQRGLARGTHAVTIAACYVNPEGVVLGADSTSSIYIAPSGFHYLNHNQKLFEIGEDTTLGLVTWGLGSIGELSHRSQIAKLADDLKSTPAKTVLEVAERFAAQVHKDYAAAHADDLAKCQTLQAKAAFKRGAVSPDPNARTEGEETDFTNLRYGLSLGFCVGGYQPI
jgi:hypothetical protein